jgi:PKD repeat protein
MRRNSLTPLAAVAVGSILLAACSDPMAAPTDESASTVAAFARKPSSGPGSPDKNKSCDENSQGKSKNDKNQCGEGGGGGTNLPPVAAFTFQTDGLKVDFDGSTSSDPDGSVAEWAWNFGDGSGASSGVTPPSYYYLAAGKYTVTLTVTDNKGATHSTTKEVEVEAGGDQCSRTEFTTLTYDFEEVFGCGWDTSASTAQWAASNIAPITGSFSAQASGGDFLVSRLMLPVTCDANGTVAFNWKVDSEQGGFEDEWDPFVFGLVRYDRDNPSFLLREGGLNGGSFTHTLGAGDHELHFTFTRDGSGGGGANAAWLDDVAVSNCKFRGTP